MNDKCLIEELDQLTAMKEKGVRIAGAPNSETILL